MTGYDTTALLADVEVIYQQGVTDGGTAQATTDQAAVAALNATISGLQAEETLDEATIASLKAQIAVLQQGSGSTPPANYGGSDGWAIAQVVDLTTEPKGTAYTTGNRASTDSTQNRQAQAKYGPDGLTVTAARSGSTIFSADVMLEGVTMTSPWAIEADIEMTGLGVGMGPAFWSRAKNGKGEIDFLEYLGSNAGKGIAGGKGKFESKVTLINTGSPTYNQGQDAAGIPAGADGSYEGLRRYRAELTDDGFSEWVDGVLVWAESKAAFEKSAGAGKYSQFMAGTTWYPRLTFQAGNGTSSKLWGTVPASFLSATIRLGALRVYARA